MQGKYLVDSSTTRTLNCHPELNQMNAYTRLREANVRVR
jgi:hypothetical protein